MAFQPPYDYNIHLGSVEAFDPKNPAIQLSAHDKMEEGNQLLADALGIQIGQLPDFGGKLYIVQLEAAPSEEDMGINAENNPLFGLSFQHPFSEVSYLERLDSLSFDQIFNAQNEKYSGIRAVVPYWPELKVHIKNITGEELEIGLYNADNLQLVQNVLIELGANPNSIISDISNDDTIVIAKFNSPISIDLISCISEVIWVKKNSADIPLNLNVSGVAQSGNPPIARLNLDGTLIRTANETTHPIWERGLHGEGQIIGVVDLGDLNLSNPFLTHSTNESMEPGESHRKIIKIIPRPDSTSNSSHAMMVVGCAIADHFDEPGEHQHRGGAWAARILYADRRALDNLSAFLDNCIENKALIINRSLMQFVDDVKMEDGEAKTYNETSNIPEGFKIGDSVKPGTKVAYGPVAKKIDRFLFQNQDYIFINASPNTRHGYGDCGVVAKNSVVVGGVLSPPAHNSRTRDLISRQEDPGERSTTADNRIKPDILAVSQNITTTDLDEETISWQRPANSFAAPHVSAAAALVRQYYMEGWHNNGFRDPDNGVTPSGSLIKATLLNATVPLPDKNKYPFEGDGWGRLQLNRTLAFQNSNNTLFVFDIPNEAGIQRQSEFIGMPPHKFQIKENARRVKITLVYNDIPSDAPNDDSPVRNNIRLKLSVPFKLGDFVSPTYYCNGFIEGSLVSQPFTMFDSPIFGDTINNVRQIVLDRNESDIPIGEWLVNINAVSFHRKRTRELMNEALQRDKVDLTDHNWGQGYAIVVSIEYD